MRETETGKKLNSLELEFRNDGKSRKPRRNKMPIDRSENIESATELVLEASASEPSSKITTSPNCSNAEFQHNSPLQPEYPLHKKHQGLFKLHPFSMTIFQKEFPTYEIGK